MLLILRELIFLVARCVMPMSRIIVGDFYKTTEDELTESVWFVLIRNSDCEKAELFL